MGLGCALRLSATNYSGTLRVFGGCVTDPLQLNAAFLPGSKWSVLFFGVVTQDAVREVLKVCVDDMKIHVWVKNQEFSQAVPMVVSELKSVYKKQR